MLDRKTSSEILRVLKLIDTGKTDVVCLETQSKFCLKFYIPEYSWVIGVFNDCGSFDYIDFIVDGMNEVIFDFSRDADHKLTPVHTYRPSDIAEYKYWKMNN